MTAKVKEAMVGGDDVENDDTQRLEPDNETWWCVTVCTRMDEIMEEE